MKLSPKQRKIFILFIIGIFILIGLNLYQKEVRNFFYSISLPTQKFFWQKGQGISNFLKSISQIDDLKKESEELKLKNQELLREILILKKLEKENEILREALNLNLEKEFKLLIVEVAGKDIFRDSVFIDKGSKDGSRVGLPLINQSKVLLGKVEKIYDNYSQVILISDPKSTIPVKIAEKEVEGIARGEGNFKVLLDLIPLEAEIKTGDLVLTSGLAENLPKELLVGKIDKILKSDIESFQKAEILPSFEIENLKFAFLILDF